MHARPRKRRLPPSCRVRSQLGLTFSNDEGELAPGVCTSQFNFKFSLSEDIYAQDSIDLLTRSGIDFRRHEEYGIDVIDFAELFISSGCVLVDDVKWISFHSGYDFGYLMKLLTCAIARCPRAGPDACCAAACCTTALVPRHTQPAR